MDDSIRNTGPCAPRWQAVMRAQKRRLAMLGIASALFVAAVAASAQQFAVIGLCAAYGVASAVLLAALLCGMDEEALCAEARDREAQDREAQDREAQDREAQAGRQDGRLLIGPLETDDCTPRARKPFVVRPLDMAGAREGGMD